MLIYQSKSKLWNNKLRPFWRKIKITDNLKPKVPIYWPHHDRLTFADISPGWNMQHNKPSTSAASTTPTTAVRFTPIPAPSSSSTAATGSSASTSISTSTISVRRDAVKKKSNSRKLVVSKNVLIPVEYWISSIGVWTERATLSFNKSNKKLYLDILDQEFAKR